MSGAEAELAALEEGLAVLYGLSLPSGEVRAELVRRVRSGQIPETAQVQRWIGLLAFVLHGRSGQ